MTTADIFRVLPTSGDAGHLGLSNCGRAPTIDSMRGTAVTAERTAAERGARGRRDRAGRGRTVRRP